MTRIGTLWGDARQRQSKVILSAAALNGFELDLPQWSFENRPAEYVAKFPYGKIPAFEDTDGFKLMEGAAIARYLCSIGSVNLLGSNAKEAAIIDQYAHFADHEIGSPIYSLAGLVYGFTKPFSRETLDGLTERAVRALKYLEAHLATRPSGYVALDTLTFADLILVGVINHASRIALGAAERAEYPHIFAHYAKVTGDERIKKYWGTKGFLDTRITELTALPTNWD